MRELLHETFEYLFLSLTVREAQKLGVGVIISKVIAGKFLLGNRVQSKIPQSIRTHKLSDNFSFPLEM